MACDNSEEIGCAERVGALWDAYVEEHDVLTHNFVCEYLSCGNDLTRARRLSARHGPRSSKLLTDYLDKIAEAFGGKEEAKSLHEQFFGLLNSMYQQTNENN